jgi:hypothetical protein
MKDYLCHKHVRATQIIDIVIEPANNGDVVAMRCDDGAIFRSCVGSGLCARGVPSLLDYIVAYDDGYISWSPQKVFEDGYTLVPERETPSVGELGWSE